MANPYKGKKLSEAIAWEEGLQVGLKCGFQIFCKHPTDSVESVFSEDENWAVCTLCDKDMTKEYLAKMPEPDLDDVAERMVF